MPLLQSPVCAKRTLTSTISTRPSSSLINPTDTDREHPFRCFPIVPKIASHHLGLPIADPSRPSTLLGGLTFFGGEANNYSMHVSRRP